MKKIYLKGSILQKNPVPEQAKSSNESKDIEAFGNGHGEESCISLLQREFSESVDLSWPFQKAATKPELGADQRPVILSAMEDLLEKADVDSSSSSSSVSFDSASSPKSRPGWPLLMIQVPSGSNDPWSEPENAIDENRDELDLILKTAVSSGCKVFSYAQLSAATSRFSSENVIGGGGCSIVYRGCLSSGETVAVKVLKSYKQALTDFALEVNVVSSIRHKNIVPFLGICLENGLLISVHEYVPKGSLETHLHDENGGLVLRWEARFNVGVAIGEALAYLHNHYSPILIIHRDVKSSNILLTHQLQPMLSDFGLATWGSANSAYSVQNELAGTFGYMAPEYFMYGRMTEKIDVFALGVVLVELLSGRRPISLTRKESLLLWAQNVLEKHDYDALIDPKLKGLFDVAQMQRMALAAKLCISRSPRLRPTITQVVDILKDCRGVEDLYRSYLLNLEASNEDDGDDEESIYEFGVRDRLSLGCVGAEDGRESNTPSSLSLSSERTSLKLKDFLQHSLD